MELMKDYKICFACSLPGEPGCGCPDNDFYAEHKFRGTYCEAEREAKRISFEVYRGDFGWWIIEVGKKEKSELEERL